MCIDRDVEWCAATAENVPWLFTGKVQLIGKPLMFAIIEGFDVVIGATNYDYRGDDEYLTQRDFVWHISRKCERQIGPDEIETIIDEDWGYADTLEEATSVALEAVETNKAILPVRDDDEDPASYARDYLRTVREQRQIRRLLATGAKPASLVADFPAWDLQRILHEQFLVENGYVEIAISPKEIMTRRTAGEITSEEMVKELCDYPYTFPYDAYPDLWEPLYRPGTWDQVRGAWISKQLSNEEFEPIRLAVGADEQGYRYATSCEHRDDRLCDKCLRPFG